MFPAFLDHLILGASDLARGIDFIEQGTGVRAAFGGVHPGRGTHNALLSLGVHCYLEILAPDPNQNTLAWFHKLPQLREPRLVGWMAHVPDIEALAAKLRESGIVFDGPNQNWRLRPDGRRLTWKLLRLAENPNGLLPIFIEWSTDSPHPADDPPSGLRLVRFEIASPDHQELANIFRRLQLDLRVVSGNCPLLEAGIAGPKGTAELIS